MSSYAVAEGGRSDLLGCVGLASNGVDEQRRAFQDALATELENGELVDTIALNPERTEMFEELLKAWRESIETAEVDAPESLCEMRTTEFMMVMVAELIEYHKIEITREAEVIMVLCQDFISCLPKFFQGWKAVANYNNSGTCVPDCHRG